MIMTYKYKQHVYYPIINMGDYRLDPYSYGYCVCRFSKTDAMASREEFESIRKCCNDPDVILTLLRERGKHR